MNTLCGYHMERIANKSLSFGSVPRKAIKVLEVILTLFTLIIPGALLQDYVVKSQKSKIFDNSVRQNVSVHEIF